MLNYPVVSIESVILVSLFLAFNRNASFGTFLWCKWKLLLSSLDELARKTKVWEISTLPKVSLLLLDLMMVMIMMMMMMNCFCGIIDRRKVVRCTSIVNFLTGSNHCKSSTRHEQVLNLSRTWVQTLLNEVMQ